MRDSRGQLRRTALLVVATAALALLGATSALGQVAQTPKNGCESPEAYSGSLTSDPFPPGGAQLRFDAWYEVESIDPVSHDVIGVEWKPAADADWMPDPLLTLNGDGTPSVGAADQPWTNLDVPGEVPAESPAFEAFSVPLPTNQSTDIQLRIRFDSRDGSYQGFRGTGVDNIEIDQASGPPLVENFETSQPSWSFEAPVPANGPFWQVVSDSDGIAVASPEIFPDLVTLWDAGSLPSNGSSYAWFGDTASGTYCGPDFANRVPAEPTPPEQTGTGTTTPTTEQARRQTLADLPPPVLGRVANVEPVKGTVLVAVPVSAARSASVGEAIASQKGLKFVPLAEARQVPVGSFLDTRKGTVRLQAAATGAAKPYLGSFDGGLFQMRQSRKRSAKGLTDLVLKGGKFGACAPQRRGRRGKGASTAVSKRRLRRLRANGTGRFRTRGRYSAATVRGTKWTVTDRCDGTLTQVSRGRVAVRDFRRKKTILLRAGKSYLARAKR
jgi:hypothetical protein